MQEQQQLEGDNLDVNYREIDVLEREFQQVGQAANVDPERPSRRPVAAQI